MLAFETNMIYTNAAGDETSVPVMVNGEFVRAAYKRQNGDGRGTRLTFADGHGFAVTAEFEEIKASLQSQPMVEVNMVRSEGYDQEENQIPAVINSKFVRAMYPRHGDNAVGTRITFADGGGFAVADLFADLKNKIAPSVN